MEYSVRIFQHIVIPEAENAVAGRPDKASAYRIALLVVLPPIQFDDEPGFATNKICNVRANSSLSAKV